MPASALSYEYAGTIEAQLKAEVADLMAKAEAADQADIPDGFSIPEELERREERLRKLSLGRDGRFPIDLDGKRKARPPAALIVVVGVEVKGASHESA